MKTSFHSQRISIFIAVNPKSIHEYFNVNDPAPLKYRQLSTEFQEYLNNSVANARRHTIINYKIFCGVSSSMRFLADPLMQAVRRHFAVRRMLKEQEFKKFKKRNYLLLCISICVVMFCQGLLPLIVNQEHRIHSMFSNALDVFSWVILWKPIERLIFYWNPFLKDILLYEKLENCEALLIENEQELVNYHMEHFDAA
jgi:hypothetical protein